MKTGVLPGSDLSQLPSRVELLDGVLQPGRKQLVEASSVRLRQAPLLNRLQVHSEELGKQRAQLLHIPGDGPKHGQDHRQELASVDAWIVQGQDLHPSGREYSVLGGAMGYFRLLSGGSGLRVSKDKTDSLPGTTVSIKAQEKVCSPGWSPEA